MFFDTADQNYVTARAVIEWAPDHIELGKGEGELRQLLAAHPLPPP